MKAGDGVGTSRRAFLNLLRNVSGRLAQLVIAAFLGNRYLYEVRDTTPGTTKLLVVLTVFVLVGLATS